MAITDFRGRHGFLSNFYRSPIVIDDMRCATVEHAFQALKTLDTVAREHVRSAPTAAEAKKRGRVVLLRPDWDAIRVSEMRRCLREKFSDLTLMAQLQATGNEELIEGNYWHDYFWGVCNGRGENWLGKLRMSGSRLNRPVCGRPNR
jgi:ribA/ribD-fused uncharacterized protein